MNTELSRFEEEVNFRGTVYGRCEAVKEIEISIADPGHYVPTSAELQDDPGDFLEGATHKLTVIAGAVIKISIID